MTEGHITDTTDRRFYLILGARSSGRRALLADLIDGAALGQASTRVLLSEAEHDAAGPLSDAGVSLDAYRLEPTGAHTAPRLTAAALPESTQTIFLLTDGATDPVDQVEAVRDWLGEEGIMLTRVLTVIHGGLLSAHPDLQRWFDACIHFSDVLILNRREGLPQRFLGDFKQRVRKQALPCLLELAKRDRLDNPPRVLEPQARRLSLIFDAPDEAALGALGEDDEDAIDEAFEDEPESDDADPDALPYTLEGREDPWLARQANGQRQRRLPDITGFLPQPPPTPSATSGSA